MKWFVIGISGVTCGGKSLLAGLLHKALPLSKVIVQDDFFYPQGSEKHEFIAELNHNNWDTITSLDMDYMYKTVTSILAEKPQGTGNIQNMVTAGKSTTTGCSVAWKELEKMVKKKTLTRFSDIPVLIMDGFLLFNYKPTTDLCHMKYYFTLTKDQCWERRRKRIYDPPDVPGYFETCVWPEYVKHRDVVLQTIPDIVYIDGNLDMDVIYNKILDEVTKALDVFIIDGRI